MKFIFSMIFLVAMSACWSSKPKSFESLSAAYRAAHSEKSIEKLMTLVSRSNSFEDQRASFEMSFQEDVDRPIESIELLPLDSEELSYQLDGKTYRPHFPPAGRMKVSFAVGENDIQASSYLVGQKDGHWFIVSAEAE